MAPLTNESFKKFYYGHYFSCAWIFCVLIFAMIIIIPFFIAYSTNNFWLSSKTGFEQPTVKYRNEAILFVYENGGSSAYSTVSSLNQRFPNQVVSPSIKVIPYDNNNDGKADKFNFEVSFFSSTDTIQKIVLLLFFDYGFSSVIRQQLMDFALVELTSANGISGATVYGDLDLHQRVPMTGSAITRRIYNVSFFDQAYLEPNWFDMVQEKAMRNESLTFNYQKFVQPGAGSATTTLQIQINIPPYQSILYVPTIIENLRYSWIQYIMIFVPIYYILVRLLRFAYRNRIFSTQTRTNFPLPSAKKVD